MAELIGLLASIAGVATAGIQVSTLLYKTVQDIRGLGEEITSVARDVKILSVVFGELSDAIQTSRANGIDVSASCMVTLAELVKDSQRLYGKIGDAVEGSKGPVRAQWLFRRQDVELWKAEISKNISVLNLLITTLIWAETRRRQTPNDTPFSSKASKATKNTDDSEDNNSVMLPGSSARGKPPQQTAREDEIPALIERQVHETVLCAENLARLQEQWEVSAIRVLFATSARPDLEPRRYLMQQQLSSEQGGMRRESFDSSSVWLSEIVTIGDASALASKGWSILSANDGMSTRGRAVAEDDGEEVEESERENEDQLLEDRPVQIADRLLQGWTNLLRNEETESWEVTHPDEEAEGFGELDPSDRTSWTVQQHDGITGCEILDPLVAPTWRDPFYEPNILPYNISIEELRAIERRNRRSLRRIVKALLGRKTTDLSSARDDDLIIAQDDSIFFNEPVLKDTEKGGDGVPVLEEGFWWTRYRRNALVSGMLSYQMQLQQQNSRPVLQV